MNHLAKATQIIILVLVPIALIKLLMTSIIFCYAMGAIALIAVIIATYEYSKGKL